jgi:hypothetical protein
MDFEQAMPQVKDKLVVMAEIQRRQAEVLRMQAEHSAEIDAQVLAMKKGMALHEERMQHIDTNLAEISDKAQWADRLHGRLLPEAVRASFRDGDDVYCTS